MTPKLIALDLDETTLNRDSRLSAADRAAMERAIAKGVEIVVATGRSFGSVPQEIRTFPGIRYAITGNGAAVHDLGNGQALQRYLLPKEAVEKILDLTWGENLTYEAFIQGIAYAQADYIAAPERFWRMHRPRCIYRAPAIQWQILRHLFATTKRSWTAWIWW